MDAPLNPQDFFVAGGTLWGEASSYVARPTDEELFRLTRAGEYCNILAARQMGKSSLMVRTAARLRAAGVRTAIIDISTLGGGISSPEAWFYGFIDELAVQLGLKTVIEDWWERNHAHNAVQRFSNFLRDVVLAEISSPVAVFVDEIDSALGMAFTDDFFAAIRAASNARAIHPEFKRLTFILIGVARPADLIRDRIRTPYNIGTHVPLNDFTLEELAPFEVVLEAAFPGQGSEALRKVMHWTNGQPYLTQKLCAELIRLHPDPVSEEFVAETVERLFFTSSAQKESNLRAIRDRIESSPHRIRMLEIYRRILQGRSVLDEERSPEKNELKLSGLVRADDSGRLIVRNRTYRRVFDEDWVRKNLPVSRTRRFAVITAIVAVLAITVAVWAIYNQQQQAARTYEEQFLSSSSPDVRLTSLARLLELDERAAGQAAALFFGLSRMEQVALFTDLSDPQNVSAELVVVAEAFYQDLVDPEAGDPVLQAIRDVLGQVGAAGAPGLKTELEFWLKGREEAADHGNYQIAASLFDSAWEESERRGHPNFRVRYDRALALIALGEWGAALDDLEAVSASGVVPQEELAAVVNANPGLAFAGGQNQSQYPLLGPLITPVEATQPAAPTAAAGLSGTPLPILTASPAPTAVVETVTDDNPGPSPYAGWIAYAAGEEDSREIYLLDPQSGETLQITSNAFIDEAPAFSGDGWRMAYASRRGTAGWQLYVYDFATGIETPLTDFPGEARFPAWSPAAGDARIAFEGRAAGGSGETDLWLVDAGTGVMQQLTDSGADSRPAWSPQGDRIAFGRATSDTTGDGQITTADNLDLYVLDLASGTLQNLTGTPAQDEFNFAWSPDGSWIAFTRVSADANGDGVRNLDDSRDLHLIRPDTGEMQILSIGDQPVYSPSWSPDGLSLLFLLSFGSGENEIWQVDVGSGALAQVSERGAFYHPAYARAAHAVDPVFDLAFVSDRDGQYGVYLMDSGDPSAWQMLARPQGYERTWWPSFCGDYVLYEAQDLDGLSPQWLYFYSPDVSAPIEYRSTLNPAQLGVPRCSPDGNRIAFSIYLPADFDGWQVAVNDVLAREEYVLENNPSFGYVSWSNRSDFFLSMTIIEDEFYVLSTANFGGTASLSTLARGKYPALSPNGNQFVFLCSNQAYLCIQAVDGGTPELLVEVVSLRLAGEDLPVTAMWSADGAWIYFSSAADGDWDIYRIRPNGTGLQNLTADWDSNELMPALDQ